jgi:hypothetical protein
MRTVGAMQRRGVPWHGIERYVVGELRMIPEGTNLFEYVEERGVDDIYFSEISTTSQPELALVVAVVPATLLLFSDYTLRWTWSTTIG